MLRKSLMLFGLLFVTACGGDEASQGSAENCAVAGPVEGRALRIVTTVAPITSLVAQVVGDSGRRS